MDMPVRWRWCAVLAMILIPTMATSNEVPDLSTLEFLAEWLDVDGELLDPRMFEESGVNDDGETKANDNEPDQ